MHACQRPRCELSLETALPRRTDQFSANGARCTAKTDSGRPRDEYIVIRYIEPVFGNEKALGFNIAPQIQSDAKPSNGRETKAQARATKQTRFIYENGTVPAVVVYMPIYTNGLSHDTVEERQQRLEGYVASFSNHATSSPRSLRGANEEGLQLQLLDGSATSTQQTALSEFGRARKAGGVAKENQFGDGQRKWSLECSLSSEYFARAPLVAIVECSAVGFVPSPGCSARSYSVVTGHRQRDEVLVAERTRELVSANAMLHREIAERSVAESGLRISEAKLRSVTHSIGDAIVSADGSGSIVFWNPSAAAIFGYTETEAPWQTAHHHYPAAVSWLAPRHDSPPQSGRGNAWCRQKGGTRGP